VEHDQDRRRRWDDRYRADAAIGAPSPFVVRALERLDSIALPGIPRALDLACGRGRHALLLAERGYRVDAVDYALAALRTLHDAARSRGLEITCVAADVTAWPLPTARYALVLVVNFLDRALFPALRAAVAPGGVLLYETHRRDDTDPSRNAERADFQLAPGELQQLCRGWTVLLREDGVAEHRGRLVARSGILARRPPKIAVP
jgi:SAM-dependent methyltransferase